MTQYYYNLHTKLPVRHMRTVLNIFKVIHNFLIRLKVCLECVDLMYIRTLKAHRAPLRSITVMVHWSCNVIMSLLTGLPTRYAFRRYCPAYVLSSKLRCFEGFL